MSVSTLKGMRYGISIENFNTKNPSHFDIGNLKQAIYDNLIVVLKCQSLTPAEFVAFGRKLGQVERYYEEMYHHPEEKDIFVSSNIKEDGGHSRCSPNWKFLAF